MQRLDSHSCSNSYIGVGAHALLSSPQRSNSLTGITGVRSTRQTSKKLLRNALYAEHVPGWLFVLQPLLKMQMPPLRITQRGFYFCVVEGH